MNELLQTGASILFLLMISGCGRVTDWGKQAFYQGSPYIDSIDLPGGYIKEIVVHDQIKTEATFVALWASACSVQNTYIDLYARRLGLSVNERCLLQNSHQQEYKDKMVFYVLSLYNVPLSGSNVEWTMLLAIGDELMSPVAVSPIELKPEYKAFFGDYLTMFKDAYKVVFDVSKINACMRTEDQPINLYFRSIQKEVFLSWN